MMIHIIMASFKSLADEYRREVRKNVSLQKGH